MILSDKVTASKRLSRMKINPVSQSFNLTVMWCRTAFSSIEKWDMTNHRHSSFELHYVLNGSCCFMISNNKNVILNTDDFLLICPQQMHKLLEASDNLAKFVLAFRIETFTDNIDGLFIHKAFEENRSDMTQHGDALMRGHIKSMMDVAYHNDAGATSIISSHLSLLLIDCAKKLLPTYQGNANANSMYRTNTHVEMAQNFITDNAPNGIISGDVAKYLNISEKQLNRILLNDLNTTVAKMIEDEKMKIIRKLLLSELTLQQVAEAAGFSNEYNMSRFFKRLEGMSPGKYRKAFFK